MCSDSVDAPVEGVGRYSDSTTFFLGSQYKRYRRKADREGIGHAGRERAVVVVKDGKNERLSQPFDTTPYDAEASRDVHVGHN